jgi:hypothetical protein
MPRSVLAPLAAALSALLLGPHALADTTSPLFVVEQQRFALVSQPSRQWADAFALLPPERRLTHELYGHTASFFIQGGAGWDCGIPDGVSALAMNVYTINPTNFGFIKVWPADGAEPLVSTVNYQVGITAIATGTVVPVDASNDNQFIAKSPAAVDFVADAVGYFKSPGDATSLDIRLSGERVMRYEFKVNSPNVIRGGKENHVDSGVWGASIGGGGTVSGSPNRVSGHYGTVSGGMSNPSGPFAAPVDYHFGTVGGGWRNNAAGYASVVAEGELNTAAGGTGTPTWTCGVSGGAGLHRRVRPRRRRQDDRLRRRAGRCPRSDQGARPEDRRARGDAARRGARPAGRDRLAEARAGGAQARAR